MDSNTFGPALIFLVVFFINVARCVEDAEAPPCPEQQEAFEGSCYEFVALRRSFADAQGWCEQGGGHLAFILTDETQQFLQRHLAPDKDWWLGLAPAAPNLTLDVASTEGEAAH